MQIGEVADRAAQAIKDVKLMKLVQEGQATKPKKNKFDDPAYQGYNSFISGK